MGLATASPRLPLVGRAEEQRYLRGVLADAADGRPGVVVVHGEPGSGKTSLLREAAAEATRGGAAVLWGTCLRLAAGAAPYLPLVHALDGWMQSTPDRRAEALDAVPGLGRLLPDWRTGPVDTVDTRLLTVTARFVRWLALRQTAVLVVDDLQWADPASRDALAFLAAGLHLDRVAVLTAHRESEAALVGHPLQGWLADVRRMPHVHDLVVGPVDREATYEQLERLLGHTVPAGLVDQVVRRASGNPYFTELLAHGLDTTTDRLPEGLPAELVGAVLSAWSRLSAPARLLAVVLAVGGRPAEGADLARLHAQVAGPDVDHVAALGEAIEQGIATLRDGVVWFRHPLLAESVMATLLPGQAGPLHAAWARLLEQRHTSGIVEVRRQADLALHYEQAGRIDDAFTAALLAAQGAEDAQALREQARHLRQAARLWPRTSLAGRADQDQVAILERAARVSRLVGDSEEALEACKRAMELLDADREPLRLARLLTFWSEVAWEMGRLEVKPAEHALRAVRLSAGYPDSAEHAEALAAAANRLMWNNRPQEAMRYAERAVTAAQLSGSPAALSQAHGTRGLLGMANSAEEDTAAALGHARESRDVELIGQAYVDRMNYLLQQGRQPELLQLEREAFARMSETGAVSMALFHAGLLMEALVETGRWQEARQVLDQVLGLSGIANGAASLRLGAARLAVRRGELDTAGHHLARAAELIPGLERRAGLCAPPLLAEHLIALTRPEDALTLLGRTLPDQAVDPRVLDAMVAWGATAAGDLADHGRDRRDRSAVRRARRDLELLVDRRAELGGSLFEESGDQDVVQPALRAVFEAEVARCEAASDQAERWGRAVRACARAGLVWRQHVAGWRRGEALLRGEHDHASAAEPLRAAYAFATEVGAEPLTRAVADLARVHRVGLDRPRVPQQRTAGDDGPLAGLTRREHEVLAQLVAGRTYVEIARALFISEKTVSTHVSNLLHKTGTTSGREAAALAVRLEQRRET